MPKIVKAFKCNFCSRVFLTKRATEKHEHFCFKNHSLYGYCRRCKYLTGKVGIDNSVHRWCEKREMWILSPKAAHYAVDLNITYGPASSTPPIDCPFEERRE